MQRYKRIKILEDTATGETSRIESEFITRANSMDEFFIVFNQTIDILLTIKSANDYRVLMKLLSIMKYNENTVDFSPALREKFCAELGMHSNHVGTSLKNLVKLGLISGSRGSYIVNPFYFFKGTNDYRVSLTKQKGLKNAFGKLGE